MKIDLPLGSKFFRVRLNMPISKPSDITDSMFNTPPTEERKRFWRFDSESLPIMYLSDNLEVCLHECRMTLEDKIFAATIEVKKRLSLVDFVSELPFNGPTDFQDYNRLLKRLSYCGETEYDLCRKLSSRAAVAGFDGFCYVSYFSQARDSVERNLALFGSPIREGKLALHSVNQLRIRHAEYRFSFGPA